MGALKQILEESLKNFCYTKGKSHAEITFESYQKSFNDLCGEFAIWTTTNNPELKKPQLIEIEKTYKHYVIVRKRTFSVEGDEGFIRYAINYATILAGYDSIEILE